MFHVQQLFQAQKMRVGVPFGVFLGFCMLHGVNGNANLNSLFTDIITKFRLISPTIIYHGEIPDICLTRSWLLCLDQEKELEIQPDEDIKAAKRGKLHAIGTSCSSALSVLMVIFQSIGEPN